MTAGTPENGTDSASLSAQEIKMTYDPTPKPGKCPIKFRIEASTSDPRGRTGFERGNISAYELRLARGDAETIARNYLRAGYWVEIYNDHNDELLDGPFDPDNQPASILAFLRWDAKP